MARSPRSKVPKTSGAGVSRLSYQKGYAMGNRGRGHSGSAGAASVDYDASESKAGAPRAKPLGKSPGMNISYGETLPIGSLEDIKAVAERKPTSTNYAKQGAAVNIPYKNRPSKK